MSGQRTASEYQLTLQSVNLAEIYQWSPVLVDKMRQLSGFVDVNSDMQIASPEITLDIDRDRALALGVTPQQIQDALASSFGAREVSTIYAPANQYSVILETKREYQRSPEALSKLYLRSSQGTLTPLDSVVQYEAHDWPAEYQPLRTVASCHDLFQFEAWLLVESSCRSGRQHDP